MSWQAAWWALAGLTIAGAVSVLASREIMRMMLGLGAFLLGVAGLYALSGFGLLAVAQVFVYVGGVLVLFLFAIMAIGRDEESRRMERPFDIGAASVAVGVCVLLVAVLRSSPPAAPGPATVERTAEVLLGASLPYFEAVGVLLLAALVVALAIVQGGERR